MFTRLISYLMSITVEAWDDNNDPGWEEQSGEHNA